MVVLGGGAVSLSLSVSLFLSLGVRNLPKVAGLHDLLRMNNLMYLVFGDEKRGTEGAH